MNFSTVHFGTATIGFLEESIVKTSVGASVWEAKKFGEFSLNNGLLKKIVAKNASGKEQEIAYIDAAKYSDSYKPFELYIPTYNIAGGGDPGCFMVVCNSKYGDVGDFINFKIEQPIMDAGSELIKPFDYAGIIVAHLEKIPSPVSGEESPTRGGKGTIQDAEGENIPIELSIVVCNNNTNISWNTWLGFARYRFFGRSQGQWTTGAGEIHYAQQHAYLKEIVNDKIDDSPLNEEGEDSDFLLKNSEDERKYGINIFETTQPLIRFATSGALTGGANGNALAALESYSRFMYSLLNSQVSTANYVLVGMPWLRPGFNCWVDPLYSDTIYYISEVQQQGNPTDGATTVVSLIFGRPRGEFASNSGAFGAMNDTNENVFVNTMNSEHRVKGSGGDGPWGAYLEDAAAFQNVKAATEDYYGHEISGTVTANNSQFHKSMYVDGVKSAPLADNVDKGKVFNGEYSAEEIKAKIDSIYASAPAVVKERSAKLKTAVEGARKYIKLHYDSEKRV